MSLGQTCWWFVNHKKTYEYLYYEALFSSPMKARIETRSITKFYGCPSVKVKLKCTLLQALRMCTGRRVHTTALEGGEGSASRPGLFTPEKDPVPILQEAGRAPGPVWTGAEKFAPTGIRSSDRPASSQSLYRLRYPAPCPSVSGWFFQCRNEENTLASTESVTSTLTLWRRPSQSCRKHAAVTSGHVLLYRAFIL